MSHKFLSLTSKVLLEFISSNVYPIAQSCIGSIVATLVHSWPENVFPDVLEICTSKINAELDHGAGSNPSNIDDERVFTHSDSDSNLLWYLGILRDSSSN
jgi:hypothetical protein